MFFLRLFLFLTLSLFFFQKSLVAEATKNNLCAGIDFESTEPLFVSLGSFCGPASSIETSKKRLAAFPFDWILSVNGEKIIEMLNDNFSHFFDLNYLTPYVNGLLLHKYYHVEFSHEGDWSEDKLAKNYPAFVEKYTRRIARFRMLNDYKGKVFFIRSAWPLSTHPNYAFQHAGNLDISEEYGGRLYKALARFFPNLNFILVIFNGTSNPKEASMKFKDGIVYVRNTYYNFNEVAQNFK